jgi:VWFA-related protein
MIRLLRPFLLAYAGASLLSASPWDSEVVFRTDVSLVRVDAQVIDGANRTITDLHIEDFVLRENGRLQPIRNFASEDMPLDVLLLLDVSASMGRHVKRIAYSSRQALKVLDNSDRMAIMVFDRSTRMRLPFSSSRQELTRELDRLLGQERFNGGTDITRAMLDAASYIRREGRHDARRAIVIVTDDQTEFDRNEAAVSLALAGADTVMCALIAPGSFHTQSAGTVQIARNSGGEGMSVDQASALEETLLRIRQRYTLYFSLPEGVRPGQERNIEVGLSDSARLRFPDAEVRYRRVYMTTGDAEAAPPSVVGAPGDRGDATSSSSGAHMDCGIHRAQFSEPRNAGMTQEHRFTRLAPVSEVRAIDPIVVEMRGFQSILSAVLRKTDSAGSAEPIPTSATTAAGRYFYPVSSASSTDTDSDAGKPQGHPSNPRDSWLMKNYHFTGPPPANEVSAIDPLVFELRQIQNTVLAILRKTDFAKDYEAALAAAAQATANAQLIGSLTEGRQPPKTGQPASAALNSVPPIYLIALKDKTIDAATSYWVEGFMLNYITLHGAHVIVRLDLVDRSFSSELNHQQGLEFRIPEMDH